jgi:hypothetical protein
MDLADLRSVAIDETAAKRGHDYISLFVDIDARKVVYVTEGNDAERHPRRSATTRTGRSRRSEARARRVRTSTSKDRLQLSSSTRRRSPAILADVDGQPRQHWQMGNVLIKTVSAVANATYAITFYLRKTTS